MICLNAFVPSNATSIFHVLDANDGLTDNQVQHILQLPDGRLIVTTLGNINIYDGAQFSYIHKKDHGPYTLPDYHGAYHVYIDKNDILWVKTLQHVSCFDLKRMQYVDDIDEIFRRMGVTTPVRDIFLDEEKQLWIVTASGLRRAGHGHIYPIPADAGNLQDLEVDKDNVYLFCETGEVICYKQGQAKMAFRCAAYPKSERGYYAATSLVVKGNSHSFFQLRTGKRSIFLVFDTKTNHWNTILKTPYLLHTLAITPHHQAYITCPKGYWKYDLDKGRGELITHLHTDHGETVSETGLNTVFCDAQGGIWIGTYNRGLLYTHPESYRFSSTYTGNFHSKCKYAHVTFHHREYNMVFTDTRGWKWGATNDGLRLMIPGEKSARCIYTDNGLVNNFIHSIVEDEKGDIWVGTACGISRIAINPRKPTFSFTNFTRQDGTLDGEYCNGEAKMCKDGRIRMDGINGYTLFCPDSVKFQQTALSPVLTEISLHGEALSIGKIYDGNLIVRAAPPYVRHLYLNHDQNSLSFIFSALNFINAKHTIYRYKINGNDSRWHIAEATKSNGLVDNLGRLHLSFINMPYGTYHLQVMASTDINKWNGKSYAITFTINAPWWQSTLAYSIYFILVIGIIGISIHFYLRVMRNRIRQKQKEEALLKRIQDLVRQVEFDQNDSGESAEDDSKNTITSKSHQKQSAVMRQEDAEFVRKAALLVETHINEQGYSVSELSRDLCMERTGLYKKLTALIDESPTLFIRHIRLQKAAELIAEGRLSIGDIAFKTGFSSSSYLSKCFQDEFGCKPSEYQK